jgi:glycosyltransferase involved in cell wall biosynthesis
VQERAPQAFAKPIIALLRDEPLRARMGAAGFQRCTELFEVEKTIGQLERFYESLTAARP